MRIEVIANPAAAPKEKGDLLEELAGTLLRAQSFEVRDQVRLTACELDLLCHHQVSGKIIYVECKAHRENLPANALTNLLGTITFKGYNEGWLVTTGPLSKDAKGFLEEWERKPIEERSRLSIYTPERVVEALENAGVVSPPPINEAVSFLSTEDRVGEWTLLVSQWGTFWACPCLEGGVPVGVAVFKSKNGFRVTDADLLGRLSRTDTTLSNLAFGYGSAKRADAVPEPAETIVVEVEFGESWTDYRPSRPEHFVGRTKVQKDLLQFLANVKKGRTDTRVFAVKGDSGIGKSSLIAKLRDRAIKSKKPSNLFVFAVDVRAASNPGYVYASLLEALKQAAKLGFGTSAGTELRVTDYSDPLNSTSISQFLQECERQKQLVVLMLDQFEELYSKPELFSLFDEARRLMFSSVSAGTSLVLGFAWKTDTTVPQDHPAYYMWHQLSDHRYEVELSPFTHADAENSIKLFERELGDRILPELRKYLIEHSQGYPWLLKKLCIHLFEQLQAGVSQSELVDRSLDIGSLFDRDLSSLTPAEDTCLKLVAKNAPIDWYEVLETTGAETVRALQDKRLLIRRGNRLNLYWDIFKEYVLTGSVPHIPFSHVPQSPSINAFLKVAVELDPIEVKKIGQLSVSSGLSSSTVRNIVHDLSMFGVASVDRDGVLLDRHIEDITARSILSHVRFVLRRHALTEIMRQHEAPSPASQDDMVPYLKRINPAAKHHSRTWKTYSNRMGQWLTITGYIKQYGNKWIYEDSGEVQQEEYSRFWGARREKRTVVFIGDAPPSRVIEALDYLRHNGPQSLTRTKSLGYRNACAVLYRFQLVEITSTHEYRVPESQATSVSSIESVWKSAQNEQTLVEVLGFLKEHPSATAAAIGNFVNEKYERNWSSASLVRVGNALRQWGSWLLLGQQSSEIPKPSGRIGTNATGKQTSQATLFDTSTE